MFPVKNTDHAISNCFTETHKINLILYSNLPHGNFNDVYYTVENFSSMLNLFMV